MLLPWSAVSCCKGHSELLQVSEHWFAARIGVRQTFCCRRPRCNGELVYVCLQPATLATTDTMDQNTHATQTSQVRSDRAMHMNLWLPSLCMCRQLPLRVSTVLLHRVSSCRHDMYFTHAGSPGFQLCQSSDSFICYTPDTPPDGAKYGCGSSTRKCSDGTQAQSYTGLKAGQLPPPSGSVSGDPFLEVRLIASVQRL